MSNAIEIEHLYKEYRLGLIGYGTLREDLQSWWAKARGKEDPNSMLFSGEHSGEGRASDHILALNDLNLTVERGERLGIIGKNGAGKTTLLKILSRIASPTSGTAKIKGRVASLIAVGTGFHRELTGRENIYLNGSILGLRKFEINQRFDEIVDFSGVEQFIDTPVKRYSSGMYIRLGFAVAAHLDPDVLIVDEVLSVGDAEFRNKAIGKMKNVSNEEGRTILFVSHNMQTIASLCSNSILMNNGSIISAGNTEQIINQYHESIKDSNINETTEIKNRDVRRGDGKVRFTKIKVKNKEGESQYGFDAGEIILLDISYKIIEPIKRLYLKVSLGKNKVNIATVGYEIPAAFIKPKNSHSICINISTKDINPGEYSLCFTLTQGRKMGCDIIDGLVNPIIIKGEIDYLNEGIFNLESKFRVNC